MQVRLVGRTHYQVLEPTMVATVIRTCTSPIQSGFRDRVSGKLVSQLSRTNTAAAGYAIDLCKSLGLLHENLVWTSLGQLLAVVFRQQMADEELALTHREKIFFLRIFLEFDGAALIFFAKRIERDAKLPKDKEPWEKVAQELFLTTYDDYLQITTDPRDRVRIRQLAERRRHRPFRGKSGPHQCFLHLHALDRLSLIERVCSNDRVYTQSSLSTGVGSPTHRLVSLIPNVAGLEQVISDGVLYNVASELLGAKICIEPLPEQEFSRTVRYVYDRVLSTGVSLCPIQTVVEAIQIESVCLGLKPLTAHEEMNRLRSMQRDAPRTMRFHVDVFGRPAFLKMS